MDTAIFIFALLLVIWLGVNLIIAAAHRRIVLSGIDLKLVAKGTKKWKPVFYGVYFKHVAIGVIKEVQR